MELTNGLVAMTPTSTAVTGTGASATINANGSVTFASCATLSLNGVFTADYDNYMVTMRASGSAGLTLRGRLRASGTDNTTANSYSTQELSADNTTFFSSRSTSNLFQVFGGLYSTQRDGLTYYFFGPYLAQPTAMRVVEGASYLSAYILDSAGTHNQSTAYDGVSWITSSGSMSGLVTVFGFNQ